MPVLTPFKLDLVGQAEIAERCGQNLSTVHNWTVRHKDFPRPYVVLKCGKVWLWDEVDAWLVPVPQKSAV